MAEWIYFLHTPRDDFAATMTPEEERVWGLHFERLKRMLADGTLIMAGPTLGRINTGIAVFEAPDEQTARHGRGPHDQQRLRHGRAARLPSLAPPRPRVDRLETEPTHAARA